MSNLSDQALIKMFDDAERKSEILIFFEYEAPNTLIRVWKNPTHVRQESIRGYLIINRPDYNGSMAEEISARLQSGMT